MKVIQLCDSLRPHGLYNPWNSPVQNPGVGSRSLLQVTSEGKNCLEGFPFDWPG